MAKINRSKIHSEICCPKCFNKNKVLISKFKNNTKIKCKQPGCDYIFVYRINCKFDSHSYKDISPDAFTHPLDRNAIAALRKIPGFDFALRKMMEYGYEKVLRVNAMADDVKVSSKTCNYVHEMAVQASNCLGVSTPDVFINQNPHPNASTFGVEYPLITIQSGLIELLTEDELYAVIAHEMSHIKCHHVLYHMLADFLVNASSVLGLAGGFIIPLNLALLEWSRKAELSADRGALVVTNNKKAYIKLLMKLAGGSEYIAEMIDENEFVEQAEQFEKITKKIGLNKFYRIASNITRTHPFPVLRANEINNWADGDEYKAIYNGEYLKRSQTSTNNKDSNNCPHCGNNIEDNNEYCEACGQNQKRLANQYDRSGYQSLVGSIKSGVNGVINICSSFRGNNGIEDTIKVCPECGAEFFDQETRFCPADGTELIDNGWNNSKAN
jgi:Zn-dependent protease with chaperone function